MTTVEIKEKQTPEMPKIEESVETTEKENIKFIDENEEIKNDLKKETEVIGDGLKKDKIFNNVSTGKTEHLYGYILPFWCFKSLLVFVLCVLYFVVMISKCNELGSRCDKERKTLETENCIHSSRLIHTDFPSS